MGVRVHIPVQEILSKMGLDERGMMQKRFTNRIRRYMDDYVPLDTGMLKNSATMTDKEIIYLTPYAAKQYYENNGSKQRGRRGKYWDERMMADQREKLAKETESDLRSRLK